MAKSRWKTKAECTPEEWEAVLKKSALSRDKHRTEINERAKARRATPEEQEKKRLYYAKPEVAEKRKARYNSPEYKEQRKKKREADWADPAKRRKIIDSSINARAGFTNELIDAVFAAQGGKCPICLRDLDRNKIRRDHCHDTNTPRGLLCHACNLMEGVVRNMGISPEEFGRRLSHYLSNPPALLVQRK